MKKKVIYRFLATMPLAAFLSWLFGASFHWFTPLIFITGWVVAEAIGVLLVSLFKNYSKRNIRRLLWWSVKSVWLLSWVRLLKICIVIVALNFCWEAIRGSYEANQIPEAFAITFFAGMFFMSGANALFALVRNMIERIQWLIQNHSLMMHDKELVFKK